MPTLEAQQEVIATAENPTSDVQVATANPDAQMPLPEATTDARGYDYTRADGTVEHASTSEEARRLCPVLGGMSVEQADVILELSAIGKEQLAEQAAKRAEPTKASKDTLPEPQAVLRETGLTIETLTTNTVEPISPKDEAIRDIVLPEQLGLAPELLEPVSKAAEADEDPVVLSSSDLQAAEAPRRIVAQEPPPKELTVETTDLADLVQLRPAPKTAEIEAEYTTLSADELVLDASDYSLDESPQTEDNDDFAMASYHELVRGPISAITDIELVHGQNTVGEVTTNDVEVVSLPFETKEEQLQTTMTLMTEVFDLPIEGFEPEELIEINEMLESLLTEIELNLDDLDLDIEVLLASETFIEILSELQEKLEMDFDEKDIKLFIELLVRQYRLEETKSNVIDIDFLNRMGTREYRKDDGRPTTRAVRYIGEQAFTILRLGGISILQAA